MSTILSTLARRSAAAGHKRTAAAAAINSRQLLQVILSTGKVRHHSTRVLPSGDQLPFVAKPFSYAHGRSQYELIYKTIGQLLDDRVAAETGRPMFVSHHEGIKRTFTAFNEDVNRVAKAMTEELGLQRGDVVGLWGCNTYNWITIQYACARLGVILCTINPFYQAVELDYALRKGDIKALFMPGRNSPQQVVNRFEKILHEALQVQDQSAVTDPLILRHIITIDGEPYSEGEFKGAAAKSNNTTSFKMHSLEKLKSTKSTSSLDASLLQLVSPDDPSIIMFTSGTTGKPKGAYLSQFTLANNAYLAAKSYQNTDPAELSMCCPLPFFHSFAATHGAIAMTASPFQLVIPYLKYDVRAITESINANRCTHIVATPTLVIDLLNSVKREGVTLNSLRSCLAGGASMPVETARQFCEAIPSLTDFRIGYGATELGPASTGLRTSYSFEKRTETIGTPIDFVEIKLVNPETRQIVKIGETGEIHSRGFNTMIGYWKDPAKTAEAIDQAGWYNTGDLGVMDEEGFLRIIGRTKELIIVGGENVYPREIEELLHTHPAILDAHVIGVPDPRKGEEICAWVKLKNGGDDKVTEEELKKFCKDNLTYFKVPRYFLFVDAFPVTSVGKAKKFVMREITCKKLGLKENN